MICRCGLTRTSLPTVWIDCLHTITASFCLLYSDITSYVSETLGRVSIMLRYLEPEALLHSRSVPEGVFSAVSVCSCFSSPEVSLPPQVFEVYIQEVLSVSTIQVSLFVCSSLCYCNIFHCWLPYCCQPVLSLQARLLLP